MLDFQAPIRPGCWRPRPQLTAASSRLSALGSRLSGPRACGQVEHLEARKAAGKGPHSRPERYRISGSRSARLSAPSVAGRSPGHSWQRLPLWAPVWGPRREKGRPNWRGRGQAQVDRARRLPGAERIGSPQAWQLDYNVIKFGAPHRPGSHSADGADKGLAASGVAARRPPPARPDGHLHNPSPRSPQSVPVGDEARWLAGRPAHWQSCRAVGAGHESRARPPPSNSLIGRPSPADSRSH